tara:strand:+ start:514 stop:1104 length:591 start_codon:yes stop_codon:yes gene_type:complete
MKKKINNSIILASNSPRRKKLLEQIDLIFDVIPSNIHETTNLDLEPSLFVEHYAYEKAHHVANSNQNKWIIGADTIVVFDNNIFGKPKDKSESYEMLNRLSGKIHKVYTGVSIQNKKKGIVKTFYEKTEVEFNTLTKSDILYYINTYKPFDRAGSYGIQDSFSIHIKRINGCYYNVMGLPLARFYKNFSRLINLYH